MLVAEDKFVTVTAAGTMQKSVSGRLNWALGVWVGVTTKDAVSWVVQPHELVRMALGEKALDDV